MLALVAAWISKPNVALRGAIENLQKSIESKEINTRTHQEWKFTEGLMPMCPGSLIMYTCTACVDMEQMARRLEGQGCDTSSFTWVTCLSDIRSRPQTALGRQSQTAHHQPQYLLCSSINRTLPTIFMCSLFYISPPRSSLALQRWEDACS